MKVSKLEVMFILCALLVASIACGGKSGFSNLPDLVVEKCEVTGYSCDIAIVVDVKNIGTADAGPFTVTVEGTEITGNRESVNVSGLPAGQEKSLRLEYRYFGSGGSFGTSMVATVDADMQVIESNESNNQLTGVQPMPPPPCPSPTPTPTL